MPIYEYHCDPCAHTFETLTRSSSDVAHCPKCGSIDVKKQFSVPASAQIAGGARMSLPIASGNSGACGMGGCGSGMCSPD